jgi:hypothetical protein
MSKKTGISFPHPVIGNGDDVEGLFVVNLIAELVGDDLKLAQDGDVEITNSYFKELMESKIIVPAFKILSPGTLFADVHTGELNTVIKCSVLSWKVEIETFLIAADNIDDYSDTSFHEDFFLGKPDRKFKVEKGMIVGFGTSKHVFFDPVYLNSLSGIITFNPVATHKPVSFDTQGDKIVINYPKEEGKIDMVSMLSQKTSKFKDTFLNLFILPALSASYDSLKKAEDEGVYSAFIEEHTWAAVIDTLGPAWGNEDSFVLAQQFLQKMISRKQSSSPSQTVPVPVVSSFRELQKHML